MTNCYEKYGEEHFGRVLAAAMDDPEGETIINRPTGKRPAKAKRKPMPEVGE